MAEELVWEREPYPPWRPLGNPDEEQTMRQIVWDASPLGTPAATAAQANVLVIREGDPVAARPLQGAAFPRQAVTLHLPRANAGEVASKIEVVRKAGDVAVLLWSGKHGDAPRWHRVISLPSR